MLSGEQNPKRSFWTTVPGILTAVAALITALTGVYLALKPTDKKPKQTPVIWEKVVIDRFSSPGPPWPDWWPIKKFSDENANLQWTIHNGKYRWDINYIENAEMFWPSPYLSVLEFKAAVDIKFVQSDNSFAAAGILFGHSDKDDYIYKLSNEGTFTLQFWDDDKRYWHPIIDWRPAQISLEETNRLEVTVEDNIIRLYINKVFQQDIRQPNFTGGTVGLVVYGLKGSNVIVDFDNFELNRRFEE